LKGFQFFMPQNLNHENESRIWDAFRHGEHGALELIYRQYSVILYRYGFRFVGNPAMLEDILQDFFLYLIDHRYNLGKTTSVRYYLLKSFRRFLFRKVKSGLRYKGTPLTDDLNFTLEFSMETFSDKQEDQKEKREKLREALGLLTRQQREAIYLRFYVGLDYQEIAEIMEIKYQSSRTLVYLAIKSLREIFSSGGHLSKT